MHPADPPVDRRRFDLARTRAVPRRSAWVSLVSPAAAGPARRPARAQGERAGRQRGRIGEEAMRARAYAWVLSSNAPGSSRWRTSAGEIGPRPCVRVGKRRAYLIRWQAAWRVEASLAGGPQGLVALDLRQHDLAHPHRSRGSPRPPRRSRTNSSASSSVSLRCASRRTSTSEVEERMFVRCFSLTRVDVEVLRARVLADDHPLVDLLARADEQRAALLQREQREGDRLAPAVGDERARRRASSSSPAHGSQRSNTWCMIPCRASR